MKLDRLVEVLRKVCYTHVFFLGLFIISFLLGFSDAIPTPAIDVGWKAGSSSDSYVPSYSAESGRELAFIFIGGSGCMASNMEELPRMIRELKLSARNHAINYDRSFVAVGVARDWDVREGINYLDRFGTFDEAMAGRGWLNTGILKYIYGDIPGRGAIPQILVVDRYVSGRDSSIRSISDEVLLARKIGVDEIRDWFELGGPLPTLDNG